MSVPAPQTVCLMACEFFSEWRFIVCRPSWGAGALSVNDVPVFKEQNTSKQQPLNEQSNASVMWTTQLATLQRVKLARNSPDLLLYYVRGLESCTNLELADWKEWINKGMPITVGPKLAQLGAQWLRIWNRVDPCPLVSKDSHSATVGVRYTLHPLIAWNESDGNLTCPSMQGSPHSRHALLIRQASHDVVEPLHARQLEWTRAMQNNAREARYISGDLTPGRIKTVKCWTILVSAIY